MSATEQNTQHEVTLDQALELAQGHHQVGNLIIADRTYRDILKAVPDHFPTVHYLATLLYQRGNLEDALAYSQKAVEVAPEDKACWVNNGVILAANGQTEEALRAFDEALAIDPELYEAYSNKAYALWELGRYEEAEDIATQAVSINPDNADAYINLGISMAEQGKLEEAFGVWEQAVALDPQSARAYSNWSNTLRSMGRLEEAKQKALKAVELEDKNPESYNNLANAYRDMGQMPEAEEAYRKATDLKPDYYLAHNNLATALLDQGRFAEAATAARYAMSFKPDYAPAYNNLSLAQQGLGNYDEAYSAADRAISLDPNDAGHYLNLADILIAIDKFDDGEAILQQAQALEPDSARTLLKLADVHRNLDRPDKAIEALDKAIELNPEMPLTYVHKARVLQHDNRVEEALVVIEKALELFPDNPYALLAKVDCLLTTNRKDQAREVLDKVRELGGNLLGFYYNLTNFKKFTADDEDFLAMKKLAENIDNFGLDGKAILNFSLFKAYEDMGEYEKSFECLKSANDAKRDSLPFRALQESTMVENKKATFTPAFMKEYEGKGCDSDVPVFILGMPRSGTTLTEQIISSHPQVFGAGELPDLGTVLREMGPMTPANAAAMGQAYVDRIKARDVTGKAIRITDKMPGHCNNIALIRCMLPNAKIILCRRNPIDNCLSCYKQNFATGHYWSYNLETMAGHYNKFAELMDYWKELIPDGFIEVQYEETVNNFEEQARRLIDYVGLEWDDACLEPHKQKRAVLTASKDQVIRPVYKSSVEAWRRYEEQLRPLIEGIKYP